MAPKKVGIAMAYPHPDYEVFVNRIINELKHAEISYKYMHKHGKTTTLNYKIIFRVDFCGVKLSRNLNN